MNSPKTIQGIINNFPRKASLVNNQNLITIFFSMQPLLENR